MGDSFDFLAGSGSAFWMDPPIFGTVGPSTNDLMAIWSAILTSFLAAFLASVGFCAMKASVIGALDTGLGRGSCSTEVISELRGFETGFGGSSSIC